VVCCLVLLGAAAPAPAAANDAPAAPGNPSGPETPAIVAVYPNPVPDGDRGEFVVLRLPSDRRSPLTLSDGEADRTVPANATGRVVFSTAPARTAALTGADPRRLPDGFALANGGERLVLRDGDRVVDAVAYGDAPESELFRPQTGEWAPLGATDRPVVRAGRGTARVFTLPDAPSVAVETLRGADRRILLAGYTLTAERVTDALVAAHRRGVTVRVLVDGSPVGGMPARQRERLDRLAAAGVDVRAVGGDRARYAFHHAKYAVADDRALVTTENWKAAGTGGHGSRGWGVVTDQPAVVRGLATTFRADAGWRDGIAWREYRETVETTRGRSANTTFPRRFAPERVPVERARLLVAPDNAERTVVGLLGNATESVRVEQVSIGSRRQPFVRAALDAARRGVRVRILLSGAWYVRAENRNLTRWLNDRADAEGLPLSAKVADPRGRFEKIHAKGVVVDGDRAVVGSLNWNNHSARENREVAVVLTGEAVGGYFGRVFRADWRGGRWVVPAGVVVAAALAWLVAGWRGSRIEFE
jgi:phosphatidylserine/phosphatidylglycerophosphate/cardiolipin synthase-like enzyme